MKKTKSKKMESKVSEIVTLKAKIKELTAQVTAATNDVKEFIGEPGELAVGSYLAVLSEQERKSLDRKGLEAEFGVDALEPFTKVKTIKTLNIKPL